MQDFGTHRHLRPQGRRGGGAALCRRAAAVRARRESRLHRVAGGDLADDGRPRAERRAADASRRSLKARSACRSGSRTSRICSQDLAQALARCRGLRGGQAQTFRTLENSRAASALCATTLSHLSSPPTSPLYVTFQVMRSRNPEARVQSQRVQLRTRIALGRIRMSIEAPAIPYNFADLEPAMSRDTLVFHFCATSACASIACAPCCAARDWRPCRLEELIRATERTRPSTRCIAGRRRCGITPSTGSPCGRAAAARAPVPSASTSAAASARTSASSREFREAAKRALRQRLDVAGVARAARCRSSPRSNAGTPLVRGDAALLGARPVGARLLSGLPEPARAPTSTPSSRTW